MSRIIMVTGGGRSGKSSFALDLAMKYQNRIFIATAEPFDDEMRGRINRHKDERGKLFNTVEEPLGLADALRNLKPETEVVLIDCLTVWLGNIMHHYGTEAENSEQVKAFLDVMRKPPCNIIAVTNEVGSGIIPGDKLSRIFRDSAGRINQSLAKIADEVYLIVSGLPLKLKG